MLLLLTIFTISTIATCSLSESGLYSIDQAFECIDSVTIDGTYKKNVLDVMRAYVEPYVYTDILKAPPSVEGHNDYFPTVDIKNELLKIENDNTITKFYDFYQQAFGVVTKCRDGHFNFDIKSTSEKDIYIDRIMAFIPGKFEILNEKDVRLYPIEKYNSLVPEIMKESKDKNIKSINGKDPIEFMQEFGDNYLSFRSPHGRFFYALNAISGSMLSANPLSKEEINKGLTIVYADDTSFTLNYLIGYSGSMSNSKKQNSIFSELFAERNSNKYIWENTFLNRLKEIERKKNVKQDDPLSTADKNLFCKKSDEKKVNILKLSTFNWVDDQNQMNMEYFEVFDKCVDLFNSNDYPIIIVLPLNGGGMISVSEDFVRTLAPTMTSFETTSIRISDAGKWLASSPENCPSNQNPETCQSRCNETDWINKPMTIKYMDKNNNEVEHIISQPSKFEITSFMMQRLEKKRNPTDIVIFTDGFCFSACSMFVKDMKQIGGAIIVGYGGNPNTAYDDVFDIGQSPTNVITDSNLDGYDGYKSITEKRKKLGISMRFSFRETFGMNYNEKIPREFSLDLPDKRIKSLHYSSDESIDEFMSEGLEVIKEFQTKCNKNNKKLVKVDESCKGKIENGDGGFLCGSNSQWTNQCATTSCSSFDYIYDETENKCIENKCYKCIAENCEECLYTPESNICYKCKEGYDLSENDLQCHSNDNDSDNDNGISITFIMLLSIILMVIV